MKNPHASALGKLNKGVKGRFRGRCSKRMKRILSRIKEQEENY